MRFSLLATSSNALLRGLHTCQLGFHTDEVVEHECARRAQPARNCGGVATAEP
jgi:hypothetical protein